MIKATFDELVQHGLLECRARSGEANIVNGMPWSFSFHGVPVTHHNDQCYLMPYNNTSSIRFEPGDQIEVVDGKVVAHIKAKQQWH